MKIVVLFFLIIFASNKCYSQVIYDTIITSHIEQFNIEEISNHKIIEKISQDGTYRTYRDFLLVDSIWINYGFTRSYYLDTLIRLVVNREDITYVHEFHKSGNTKSIYSVEDGVLNGEYVEFYQNGVIEKVGSYLDGLKVGNWSEFDKKGELVESGKYLILPVDEIEISRFIEFIDFWNGTSLSLKDGEWRELVNGEIKMVSYNNGEVIKINGSK